MFPRTLAVEYSGWNAYGASLQVFECGVYRMWPNPLATDAVIEPLWPLVRSVRLIWSPARVSCMWMRIWSPGLISRSLARLGLTALKFGCVRVPVNSGFAGAWDLPFLVMYAQLIGSGPPRTKLLQAAVFSTPVFWFNVRLSMVIAAQYTRAAQPNPSNW